MASTFSVSDCLKKATSLDKDIRHMTLYDLHTELQKANFQIDENSQKQLADMVLKLLGDNSNDVQGMAVKCMAPLVNKMSITQIENSIDMLCQNVLVGEGDKRDIASIALKTVISEIPFDSASGPIRKSINPLIKGIREGKSNEVRMECSDIMNDLISRFGMLVVVHHGMIQDALLEQLTSKRPPLRKRAIACLASLSVYTSEKLFTSFVNTVLAGIESSEGENLRTYIQTTNALSRIVGHRLSMFLNRIVPLLLKNADDLDSQETVIEGEDELREHIVQAFESFIIRCPRETSPYIDQIIGTCKAYLEYDPNYEYDEESDDEMGMEEDHAGADEDDEDEDDVEFSDDEDISWKVRKASAKCLTAVISSRHFPLDQLYQNLCSEDDHTLISCFREREKNVKLDIFETFIALLNQTAIQISSAQGTPNGLPMLRYRPEVHYLKSIKGYIMRKLRQQLRQKNIKVQIGIFRVLRELVLVLQADMKEFVGYFVPGVTSALSEKSDSTLKIEALVFLRFYLASNPPEAFNTYIGVLSKPVHAAVNDKYYKIIAEALRVCGQFVKVIFMLKSSPEYNNLVVSLFNVVYARLETQDIDQDVKESAITTMGLIITYLGDSLQSQLKQCFNLLLDRLRNEVTRIITTKTFAVIAQSELSINLNSILGDLVNELASFLRKNNRMLRQSSLFTLDVVVRKYGNSLDLKLFDLIIEGAAGLISDADIQLSHFALVLCSTIITVFPKSAQTMQKIVLPNTFSLLQSSALQGISLDSLLNLLSQIAQSVGVTSLINTVSAIATAPQKGANATAISKQVYGNIAKAIATLCVISQTKERDSRIASFIKDLSSPSASDSSKILALFCLGEIGLRVNLSSHSNLQKEIENCFESGSEEVKSAASFALGSVSVGDLNTYVPFIISEIRSNSKRKYLLLHSLKEIIVRSDIVAMKPFVGDVLPLLFEYSENEEDGMRNVVAECLGKTALVDPERVVPELKASISKQSSEFRRSTVTTAMKYTITEKPQAIDSILKTVIGDFIGLLNKGEPISVRRAAVLLFTAVAHNKPALIHGSLSQFLPNLYKESFTDESLIREVNLGPFKHKVDDGLELRKSTFECMDTLLDQVFEYLEPAEFIKHLQNGLCDKDQDIRMLTHLMICKVARVSPTSLLSAIDLHIILPIMDTLGKKASDNAVQVEKDRHDDLLRSALRAVYAIKKISNATETSQKLADAFKMIENDKKLHDMFIFVSNETPSEGIASVVPIGL